MSLYAQQISDAIGRNDPATLALVEDLMRINLTGLDHLTNTQLAALARRSLADAQELEEVGELRGYCDALGLAVPEWAAPTPAWGAG
ncbi:hypothetical protein [Nonomuraea angiospora]|uniref:hypothetical protein n=1 Tax=Nonomuraea angiospora TaxID=46172 RepID=UPI0029A1B728|nr:hypothetical protein [Nonomuraea angiospora]MDX3110152.1 hypothetical protein [Nonomuraea angiospora]